MVHPLKGRKQSPEHIAKRTTSMKKTMSTLDYKEKFKKICAERKHPMNGVTRKGIRWSEEMKKHIGSFHKGKIESTETRKKKSIANRKPQRVALQKRIRAGQIFPVKDSKPEKMLQIALSLHGISYQKHRQYIKGYPDLFIEPNICVFVDGDYWHCNPRKFKADDMIKIWRKQYKASDIWSKDLQVHHELNSQGFHVVRIWEYDILHNVNNCAENILYLLE